MSGEDTTLVEIVFDLVQNFTVKHFAFHLLSMDELFWRALDEKDAA